MFRRVRSSICLVIAILSGLVLLTPSLAFAANTTPDTAVALSAARGSVSDTLAGSTGGAYRYYNFRYQGSGAPVLVSLSYSPAFEGNNNQAFGFNLYGPSGLTYQGTWTGTSGNYSAIQYTVVSPAAMNILVQVYNYTDGMPVSFTLTVAGLSGGSSAGIVAKNNTTPGQAVKINTINATLGGSLVGNASGAFQYFTIRYPGGNASATITMNTTPTYTGQGQAYGFNVYRTNPVNGDSNLVASSSQTVSDVNSTTSSATISQASAGTFQLQVFNYWPGVKINYGINAAGLAGSAPAASGNTDAAHAIVLSSGHQGATEKLAGNSGGAFNYFLVNYPGSQSQLSISVTYDSTDGAPNDALGFKVYDGSTLKATALANDDGTGTQSASWGYKDDNASTFGIQVFNYAPNTNVKYTIYQVGAR